MVNICVLYTSAASCEVIKNHVEFKRIYKAKEVYDD